MRRPNFRRFQRPGPYLGLAALAYIPLFFAKRGIIGADTKIYLYLDPDRLMRTATSMWDPNVGMGTVTHQTIGYLFPMGPYYWLMEHVGMPDWVAQRLWLGCCMFAAGAGVVYLLRTMRWRGAGVTVAALAYMLSPYFLDYAAKHSVIAMPWSGLPWLLAFTIRAIRHGGWRDPALFALVVQLVGGVNAPSLALVGVAALMWIPYSIWISRECSLRRARGVVWRIGVLTTITSLWWAVGLYAQSAYGIAILKFTETAQTVANASSATEVLRGLGYWFFYGQDKYGNFVDVGGDYSQRLWLVGLSFLIPTLAFAAASSVRFRERVYFAMLVLVGTILSVGAHPWGDPPIGAAFIKAFLSADIGLAVRSLPRAVPLIALGLSVFIGAGVTAVSQRLPEKRALAGAVLIGLLIIANDPPLFDGGLIANGLSRPNDIPNYWKQDISYLNGRNDGTRVLEVPGSDFASYRWGTTVDPITPGLMDRPYVARELIPYGSPPSADLLNALDRQMQEGVLDPNAVAPIARFMGVGDINVRSDLTYERYDLPRPRVLWNFLTNSPGLGTATGFGGNAPNIPVPGLPLQDEQELETSPALPNPPQVAAIPVKDAVPIVHASPVSHPVVLAGDGEGLVDSAATGMLNGNELVFYAGSFAKDPAQLRTIAKDQAALILTDTNRRQARRWGTVHENTGVTEQAGENALKFDPSDNRLIVFSDAGDDSFTVAENRNGISAQATSYGNPVSLTSENGPTNAIDADQNGEPDLNTAWRVGGFGPVNGERIELTYGKARTADEIHLTQALTGVRNRFITKVGLRLDGGPEIPLTLDDSSRTPTGQTLHFPKSTFKKVDITIHDSEITIPGVNAHTIVRYDGISAVGFSDISVGTESPRVDRLIRLPVDLLKALGQSSINNPLGIIFTRQRVRPSSAVRADPELQLERVFDLPGTRSFALSGQVRLSAIAGDSTLDQVLGLPTEAQGGIDSVTSRRLPGDLNSRGSSTLDGDPGTWWSPGFLGQNGEWVRFATATPLTFDHLDLQVVADGRHSVPTRIHIEKCQPVPADKTINDAPCNGTTVATVDLPPVADSKVPNTVVSAPVRFPAITGSDFRVVIDASRETQTIDWFSERKITMPVGIAELGVPGLTNHPPSGTIDPVCRSGLLTVDGKDVPISLHGSVADALADKPLSMSACNAAAGLKLSGGEHIVRTASGADTGLSIDQLSLRSAAGGKADTGTATLIPARETVGPRTTVLHNHAASVDVRVNRTGAASWLVLGQSNNLGWHATLNGKDLGTPTLVNGYGNAWLIPAGTGPVVVHLTWAPQGIVWICLWLSALGAIVVMALILWPMRHRLAPVADPERPITLDSEPSRPRPWAMRRIHHYAGAPPRTKACVVTIAGSFIIWTAFIGPVAGLVLAVCTALAVRFHRARPLLTLGAPALMAFVGLYVVYEQHVHRYPIGFEWPSYFADMHQVAWSAVALLVIDVVVDRLWLRRWWPTDDSPS